MSSAGGGMGTAILQCHELTSGKYKCFYKGVWGTFHTRPKQSEMEKLNKIMSKYKCEMVQYSQGDDKYVDL